MQPSDPSLVHDRRRFLKLLGLVGMSSAIGSAAIRLDSGHAATPAATKATDAKPVAPATPPADAPISEDAKALATIVQRRHGKHLDGKQMQSVTEEINERLQSHDRLRAVKLANGDEPDTVFQA